MRNFVGIGIVTLALHFGSGLGVRAQDRIVNASSFPSVKEIANMTEIVCGPGLRLPGSAKHLATVAYIKSELDKIPGVTYTESNFTIAGWEPTGETLYEAGSALLNGKEMDIIGAYPFSKPTDGYMSAQLMYVNSTANISLLDVTGKIVVRDYKYTSIPYGFFQAISLYTTPDVAAKNGSYTRPFVTTPATDMLAASVGGAAGFISAFNVSRTQLESYYTDHSGVHWPIPAIFTGAEEYQQLVEAAAVSANFSMRIDARADNNTIVPRLEAYLPGLSNETIVVATHTDGVTYVQENGPVALLALAKYFGSLPLSSRPASIKFAFEASHLAYQKDSNKLQAISLNATYDNPDDNTAFVIAIEHLGTKAIEQVPYTNGSYGNHLALTDEPEVILWSVGPVQPARDLVISTVQGRNLSGISVSPGFPPARPERVPEYTSMGGLGTYYHTALVPTMALISGPWSLWAPSFGRDAIDFERLREQQIAIGDVILGLSQYTKAELAGNYTEYRQRFAAGAPYLPINTGQSSQYVDGPFLPGISN